MDVNCLDKPLKIIKMCTMPCGYVCNPWNLLKKKKSAFLKAEQKLDACLRTVKMMLLSPQSTVKTYEDGVELLMFFLFCYNRYEELLFSIKLYLLSKMAHTT